MSARRDIEIDSAPERAEHPEQCLCVLCRVNPHDYWSGSS